MLRAGIDTAGNAFPRVLVNAISKAIMITHTLTSDPAVGLELGRRLAVASRRQPRPSRLHTLWTRLFVRPSGKMIPAHA